MEKTNKTGNKTAGDTEYKAQPQESDFKAPPPNPLSGTQNNGGFDLGAIFTPAVLELLKHLLSGGGAMAGNYFLWIKPMQDKLEALNKKLKEQEENIKDQDNLIADLEHQLKALYREKKAAKPDNDEEDEPPSKGLRGGLFEIKRNGSSSGANRRKRNLYM